MGGVMPLDARRHNILARNRDSLITDAVQAQLDAVVQESLGALDGIVLGEYMEEAGHQDWPGFSPADLIGIRRFLEDYILYAKNRSEV
jgi:hypothetical protein